MIAPGPDRVEQAVAAALVRTAVLARAAAGASAAGAGLLVLADPWRTGALLGALVVIGGGWFAVLTRWPHVVRAPLLCLAVDQVLLVGVLVLAQGGLAYAVHAAGAAAVAGVLLGTGAVPVWAAMALQGSVAAGVLLRAERVAPDVALFVLAAPLVGVLVGVGSAAATGAVVFQVRQSLRHLEAAQRTAVAAERSRLARELHDSVVKTLRGMSLAALALPGSVQRSPDLAQDLALTISQGADAASREARDLLGGLRADSPDVGFAESLERVCRAWSQRTGITARVAAARVDPPVEVRYELTRILQEALANIDRHAGATRVAVGLARGGGMLSLVVRDDGRGFEVPTDVARLQEAGHHGLVGMTERARNVGGGLAVESAPGVGTVVRVEVPLA